MVPGLAFILFAIIPAGGAYAAEGAAVSTAAPVSYDYGMEQRGRGEYAAARETFLKLLAASPDSGGGLEGLGLTCIALGRYDEAAAALEKWNGLNPHNPYVLALLARARKGQRDEDGTLKVYEALVEADPRDCAARSRLDAGMQRLRAGVFPEAGTYRSYSIEGLDTTSPQTILYEGSSAGSRFRAPLKAGLDLIGGAGISEEAQRNHGGGFTYYDIQDQTYSTGLAGRPSRDLAWEAEFGLSRLQDLEGSAVGDRDFNRGKVSVNWRYGGTDLRFAAGSAPKFVRGSNTGRYFELMRENSARAEAEAPLLGWDWLGRAGFYSTSDGTDLGTFALRGSGEYGKNVVQSGYSHGQQEFYSASAAGRLRYVNTDSVSVGLRRYAEEKYRAGVSAGATMYSDENTLGELGAELTGWLPWATDLSGGYRFSLKDFRGVYEGYDSVDETAHWLGAYWRHCRGSNWSASASYERGFIKDSLMAYRAEKYLAELEMYAGSYASLSLQGAKKDTGGRGHSWSAGLQARYSFN